MVLTLGAALLAATLGVGESARLYSGSLLPRVAHAAPAPTAPVVRAATAHDR